MAKANDIVTLKEQLNNGKLQRLYLFYGEEEYLKEHYIQKIFDMVPDGGLEEFNRIKIEGTTNYNIYDDAFEGMPMMTDKRILFIRDSNIFILQRKGGLIPPNEDEKKFWENKFSRLSDDTVVIFCEKNVDARSSLFKLAGKVGFAVKCEFLPPAELISWAVRKAKSAGKKLEPNVAEYLIDVIDPGLNSLSNELDKLINFCDEIIYKSDVDRVVSKSMTVKIFDMVDGIIAGDIEKVFSIINNLKTQKESAFGVMYLIYSNMEKMLRLKLSNITNRNEAATLLGGSPWLAGKHVENARHFTQKKLTRLVTRVPEIDMEIKSGKIAEWDALEQYIFEAMEKKEK